MSVNLAKRHQYAVLHPSGRKTYFTDKAAAYKRATDLSRETFWGMTPVGVVFVESGAVHWLNAAHEDKRSGR